MASGMPATLTFPDSLLAGGYHHHHGCWMLSRLDAQRAHTDVGPIQETGQIGQHDNGNKDSVQLHEQLPLLPRVQDRFIGLMDAPRLSLLLEGTEVFGIVGGGDYIVCHSHVVGMLCQSNVWLLEFSFSSPMREL